MFKFDNMVLFDLVFFKDGMYFIYSFIEILLNYRDYSINKKQFFVYYVNQFVDLIFMFNKGEIVKY